MAYIIGGSDQYRAKVEQIPVKLVGVEYMVNPFKAGTGINFGQIMAGFSSGKPEQIAKASQRFDRLIEHTFGVEVAEEVQERMTDPTDYLDFSHIAKLFEYLIEAIPEDEGDSGDERNPTG